MYMNYGTKYQTQFAPDVMDALRGPAEQIVNVVWTDKNRPDYGNENPSPEYKRIKARCVHRIAIADASYADQNGNPLPNAPIVLKKRVRPTQDGNCRCELCGAKILSDFDKSLIDKIQGAIEVIDTLLAFGPELGLQEIASDRPTDPPLLSSMINIKEFMNIHLMKIVNGFNKIAMHQNEVEDLDKSLASQYFDHTTQATIW